MPSGARTLRIRELAILGVFPFNRILTLFQLVLNHLSCRSLLTNALSDPDAIRARDLFFLLVLPLSLFRKPQFHGVKPMRQRSAWYGGKNVPLAMLEGNGEPEGKLSALAWYGHTATWTLNSTILVEIK